MTGFYDSNLEGKTTFAAKKIDEYDFGFVHIKAVDDAGHDKDLKIKIEQLEKVDRAIGKMLDLLKASEDETIVCVTGDHTTPVRYGDHSHEPVPFVAGVVKSPTKRLENLKFDEIFCASGRLGRFSGDQILPFLIKLRNHLIILK